MSDPIHVYPINDLRNHDTSAPNACWCRPTRMTRNPITGKPWPDGSDRIVHHSADQREYAERAKQP
jgi:hypothetical protein